MEQLNPLDMSYGVDKINENYEISTKFTNTGERLNRNVLIIDDELPSQLLLLSQDKIWIQNY